MNKPVLLVVDDDPQVLAAVRRDLRSRYRDHYVILGVASGAEGVALGEDGVGFGEEGGVFGKECGGLREEPSGLR